MKDRERTRSRSFIAFNARLPGIHEMNITFFAHELMNPLRTMRGLLFIKLSLLPNKKLQPQSSLFHKHKVCAEIGCANGAGNSCTS